MSLIKRGVNEKQIEEFQKALLVQYAESRFNFLNCHYGLRPGLAHGILGTPGSGKSTMVKSIVSDTAEKLKCLVYLTEETVTEYQAKLKTLKCRMENVFFIMERDIRIDSFKSLDSILMYLFEEILAQGIQAFFWDNFTTSKIYESLKPNIQGYFFTKIQVFCEEHGISFFYVAHTKQGISDNHRQQIEGEDMRGSAYPFTQSPYFYIFQRFIVGTKVYAYIHVRKHRFHELEQKHYLLDFKDGIYVRDAQLEFSKLNDYFKQRNYLGKTQRKQKTEN